MTNEELLRRLNDGDPTVRDEIIIRNKPLVTYVIKRNHHYTKDPACDMDDVFSIATLGLLKAVDSYKPDKGTLFATYAMRCIVNELNMLYRRTLRHPACSMDRTINAKDATTYADLMCDPEVPMEKRVADRDVLRTAIRKIGKLEPKERMVMTIHLQNLGELRQKDIAERVGITQSYCSRIIRRAQNKLREACEYD